MSEQLNDVQGAPLKFFKLWRFCIHQITSCQLGNLSRAKKVKSYKLSPWYHVVVSNLTGGDWLTKCSTVPSVSLLDFLGFSYQCFPSLAKKKNCNKFTQECHVRSWQFQKLKCNETPYIKSSNHLKARNIRVKEFTTISFLHRLRLQCSEKVNVVQIMIFQN